MAGRSTQPLGVIEERRAMKYIWQTAQIVAFVVWVGAFLVGAPWLGAVPVNDVPSEHASELPAGCPAARVNHGTWTCNWNGTVRSNPFGFAICVATFFGAWGFLAISDGRGFFKKR